MGKFYSYILLASFFIPILNPNELKLETKLEYRRKIMLNYLI